MGFLFFVVGKITFAEYSDVRFVCPWVAGFGTVNEIGLGLFAVHDVLSFLFCRAERSFRAISLSAASAVRSSCSWSGSKALFALSLFER